MSTRFSTRKIKRMELIFNKMRKTEMRTILQREGRTREFNSDVLNRGCLLDIKLKLLSKQMDIQIWRLGKRLKIKFSI